MLKRLITTVFNSCRSCIKWQKECSECQVPLHELAQSLGNAVDAKDSTTFNHSEDVAQASELLAQLMGLSRVEIDTIHLAAHLHDIGKIGIPDSILTKPGRLDPSELLTIREHPVIGARIVQPIISFNNPAGVSDIILHHHERFDGAGYPHGLAGRNIPLGARIVAIADTMSAMLQNRHYRLATNFERTVNEILRCSGSQFDPELCAIMCNHLELFEPLFCSGHPLPPEEIKPAAAQPSKPGRINTSQTPFPTTALLSVSK